MKHVQKNVRMEGVWEDFKEKYLDIYLCSAAWLY